MQMDKQQLRQYIKVLRKTLDIDDISRNISDMIKKLPEYVASKNVMIYYPKQFEINLLSLLDDEQKNFYLPKIYGENLLVCPYKKGDELSISEFNTLEPNTLPIDKQILDLVLVPGLCGGSFGTRLGYGKGFYDRFLKDLNAISILPIPHCFLLKYIPVEPHDVRVNYIITEETVSI